ncbi:glutarate dioxygenase GlaH [Aliamphritea spongicola]|uniref:glutarate dioxygenase GlaH n=1 Tax=Aliamphritea spongicola TaxID=707589 RepID=UPI00196B7178|nr:glutarate dioxygenase GlaH [Aliamphritea spongicola]MBN3560664.1 carbon starvation induced protein CsiD [Aliamphritea spongicola]
MNAVLPDMITTQECCGFTTKPFADNPRLQVVTLQADVMQRFAEGSEHWPLQALEYKPFLRFAIADFLDELTENSLALLLNAIMRSRDTGAFLLNYAAPVEGLDAEQATELDIKLSTAVSHLIGVPNHDAMYGKFYARFTVKNTDNSDSYLRQAHRRMELHNDGTYVDERTDFVLMQKLAEVNMEGGDSLLLHVDEWQELEKFYHHPLAKQDILWGAPKSKNVSTKVQHPVFFEEDAQGKPHMLFIDQFAEPQNMAQGRYLYEMGESLEADPNFVRVPLPVGSMLVVQNHCWLHGRDKFVAHPELSRELLRQRGHFYQ